MAAPRADQIKSAVWTPTTGTVVAFAGVQDAGVDEAGTRLAWSGDGVATEQAQAMEDINGRVAITVTDAKQLNAAALRVGATGSLVVTYQKRGPRDPVAAEDITRTLSDAMVESVSEGPPHRGLSTHTITFTAVNDEGNDPITYG